MKIRNGFVSNSSSSSFVILTKLLDKKVLKKLKYIVDIINKDGESYLNEGKFAFFGTVSYHLKFIKENNIYKLFDYDDDDEDYYDEDSDDADTVDDITLIDVLMDIGVLEDFIDSGD